VRKERYVFHPTEATEEKSRWKPGGISQRLIMLKEPQKASVA
tara:strand:+ start:417 stop:542 length:126 start_codon:yes stop_codon:yes gene_type:complete